MKSTKHNLIAGVVVTTFTVGAGSLVTAQAAGDTQRGSPTASTQAPESARAQAPDRDVRAHEVIGANVKDTEGRSLGKIEDLVLDVNSGRLRYAVLSHGGFMKMGDKLFAYPVSAFRLADRGRELVLNVPRERLEDAPGFDKDRWPDFNDAGYRSSVDRHHGSGEAGGQERLARVSEVIGSDLRDRNGRDAGELKDLVFNLKDARVQYAVVDFDDDWRVGEARPPSRAGTEPQAVARAPRTDRDTTTPERSPATSTTTGTVDTTASTGTPSTGSADTTASTGTPAAGHQAMEPGRTSTQGTAGPQAGARPERAAGGWHAVPMTALQWSRQGDDRNVVIDMDPSQVRDRAGFDSDRLRNLNDPAFKQQVREQLDRSSQGRGR